MNRAGPLVPLLVALAGCGEEAATDEATATVVVGLTTDLAIGFDLHRVEVTMRIDGELLRTQDLRAEEDHLLLPEEFWFTSVPDGSTVEVAFDAYGPGDALLLRQRASTIAEAGRRPLLRVGLDEACIDVACPDDAACSAGTCVAVAREPSSLPEHDSSWLDDAPDACRSNEGESFLQVGEGRLGYASLQSGATVAVEAGPQGGYHVWLAVRGYGFRQLGSVAEVKGELSMTDHDVPTLLSVVDFARVDGACEAPGLRFRIDDGAPIEELLGQPLSIVVTISDDTGASQSATLDVLLADTFLPSP